MSLKKITLEQMKEDFSNTLSDNILEEISSYSSDNTDAINFYLKYNNLGLEVEKKEKILEVEKFPKVSFLLTSWNRSTMLITTIKSIVNLEYSNIEVVIVDDASTDDTKCKVEEIKKEYPMLSLLFIETEGKRGPGLNKRMGLDKITGDYIVFMDDDDFYIDSEWLIDAMQIFRKFPTVASVYFNSFILDEDKKKLIFSKKNRMTTLGLVKSEVIIDKFNLEIKKPNSTFPAIFDFKRYISAGAKDMKILNDTQIYLRGILAGDVYISDKVIGVYRVHGGSIGKKLSLDFIIDNLKEKEKIAHHSSKLIKDGKKWLYKQSSITLFYYVQSSEEIEWSKLIKFLREFTIKNKLVLFSQMLLRRFYYLLKQMRNKV